MVQPASSRPETSVLFSLRELRGLEQERREREAQDRRDAEAARATAVAAEVAARREAIAAAERAEREAELRIAQSREAAERAARLAVEQAEAAERVRQQAALEQQRLQQELELRRAEVAKKRPTWMLVVTGIASVAAVGLIWFAIQRQHESDTANERTAIAQQERAAAIAMAEDARTKLEQVDATLAVLDGKVSSAIHDVGISQTKADRDAAVAKLHQLEREQAEMRARSAAAKAAADLAIRRRGLVINAECANASLSKNCP